MIVLLAIGLTATVLSYDLADNGFQVIDIGHLDVEYQWYLMQAKKKMPLENRTTVNEVSDSQFNKIANYNQFKILGRIEWKKCFLSIIVPIYNVEKYIGSLVNSLVKQTNKNFEVIFIDDGSTDESMQILKEIMAGSEQEFSFKLLQQVNQGLSSARNIGILNATGEYIFFLDSDDEIEINFVETILTSCYKYSQPDTLIFDYSSIDEFGNALDSNYGHGSIYRQKDLCTSEQILTALSKGEIPTTAWSFVTKRSVIEKHDLLFSVGKNLKIPILRRKFFTLVKTLLLFL